MSTVTGTTYRMPSARLPVTNNRMAPPPVDQSKPGADARYARAGQTLVKSTLIQHTEMPEENTLKETPAEQVADTVKADLFSWDHLEGIESALTRQTIKVFNKIRMNGELFAPMMPLNYINTLGPINPIPVVEGMDEVKQSVAKVVKTAGSAADIFITKDFKCNKRSGP